MMELPRTDHDVPFNITRSSHVVLTPSDAPGFGATLDRRKLKRHAF